MQRNFLVVAESGKAREALAATIRRKGFTVTLAASPAEAIQVVQSVAVGVVAIDSRGPDAATKRLRSRILRERPECRVVVLTNFDSVRNTAELLTFAEDDYILEGEELLGLLAGGRSESVRAATEENEKATAALIEVVDVLVGLLELDDHYFGGFSHQVMRLVRAVAEEMALEGEVVREMVIATLLRDIGNAGVDADVRGRNRTFTPEQAARMREHVEGSVRLLEHIELPWKVLPVIRHHHERYDGKGYPDGLKGREIPLGSRVVTVVDAYMAMMSKRPHRAGVSSEEALEELERLAGAQFDPEVVEVLIRVVEKQHVGRRGGVKPRVLIIEPEEEFRRLLKMRLLNEGVEVEAIAELDGKLRRLRKKPPHLVLAASGTTEQDGIELLRTFRETDELHGVPFALLAPREDRFHKLRALRQGVDDYILKSDELEEVVARAENILTREAVRRDTRTSRRRRGVTGEIENLPLPDIVQILSMGMKTARVSLSSGKRTGKVWFRDGAIVHAQAEKVEGDEAFFQMLRWKRGRFELRHGVRTKKKTVENEAMFLVMEGLRQLDEEIEAARNASRS